MGTKKLRWIPLKVRAINALFFSKIYSLHDNLWNAIQNNSLRFISPSDSVNTFSSILEKVNVEPRKNV